MYNSLLFLCLLKVSLLYHDSLQHQAITTALWIIGMYTNSVYVRLVNRKKLYILFR